MKPPSAGSCEGEVANCGGLLRDPPRSAQTLRQARPGKANCGTQDAQTWWLGCKQSNHYLQELALYILSIVPHSASCERVFSILNWFTQKRRSRYTY